VAANSTFTITVTTKSNTTTVGQITTDANSTSKLEVFDTYFHRPYLEL